jgi:hypothetical protein
VHEDFADEPIVESIVHESTIQLPRP